MWLEESQTCLHHWLCKFSGMWQVMEWSDHNACEVLHTLLQRQAVVQERLVVAQEA